MQIIITGIHIEITQAMAEYTEEKLGTIRKYLKGGSSAKLTVEFSKVTEHHHKGDMYQVAALLARKGKENSLETVSEDVYKCIDLMKDKLMREVSDEKDKEISIIRRSAHKIKNLLKRN